MYIQLLVVHPKRYRYGMPKHWNEKELMEETKAATTTMQGDPNRPTWAKFGSQVPGVFYRNWGGKMKIQNLF